MNAYQTEYFDVWRRAFSVLIGWKEQQVLVWAQPLLDGLELPGMVLNEPPLYYVARELVWLQPHCDSLSQSVQHDLIRAVQTVLAPHHERELSGQIDIVATKARLNELLEKYG